MIPQLQAISALAGQYDVWFLDIWGVLHNGVRPFAGAVAAAQAFRAGGGHVILVSNSPRPCAGVIRQLDQIGVPKNAYDAVLTSGDVSRALIAAHAGKVLFHIGPARDLPLYNGIDVTLGEVEEARAVVCTGLFDDEVETPDTYTDVLSQCRARSLEMVCVNPDVKVERDGRIIYCAGAVAAVYEDLGGLVKYAGKPFAPIYDEAFKVAAGLRGAPLDKARVLAIGDGVKTDIMGAMRAGIPSIYVASAVHMDDGETLPQAAARLFPDAAQRPIAVMSALA